MGVEAIRPGLSKTQKMGFILLFIFAVFAVGLGFLQIRNTMYAPFALNKQVPPLDNAQLNGVDSLKYRDTDRDSINDFDELYIYSTSPYLSDTDSDGISDAQEIQKGTNPSCDEKKGNCNGELGISGEAIPTSGISSSSPILGENPGQSSMPQDLNVALSDPSQLRQLLLAAGVEKKVLDATSDTELLQMVKDILSSTSTLGTLESQ